MRDLKIYITIASLLLVVYLMAQYNRPKPVNWSATYAKGDKIPYGTFLLYNQLKDIFPEARIRSQRKPVYNVFKEEQIAPGNYLIIANSVELDTYDFGELLAYMKKGNQVFIAAFYLNDFLSDTLKVKINSEVVYRHEMSVLSFTNPALNPSKKYRFDRNIGDQYFSKFDTAHAIVLGKNQLGHSNFIKYPFGKGALYLMASPQFFTNYSILNPDGADYLAKALSYLHPRGDLIWDEFSSRGHEEESSMMRVFFKYPALRCTYYIALFSLIAFVLFEMKRRQRIIPLINPLKNTTVEFVEIVGQVYYQQRDNRNIAQKKIMYLMEHIRSVYRMKTTHFDQEFIETLINKSGMDEAFINNLLQQVNQCIANKQVNDQQLINLNKNIEKFYHQSR